MNEKMLTNTDDLNSRLASAQAKRRKAIAEESRIWRDIAAADRRKIVEQKIVIGAAVLRAVAAHPAAIPSMIRLLNGHVTRPSDRAALRHTALALPELEADIKTEVIS